MVAVQLLLVDSVCIISPAYVLNILICTARTHSRLLYSRRREVGRSVASVCLLVHALEIKRLELAAPKWVDI